MVCQERKHFENNGFLLISVERVNVCPIWNVRESMNANQTIIGCFSLSLNDLIFLSKPFLLFFFFTS